MRHNKFTKKNITSISDKKIIKGLKIKLKKITNKNQNFKQNKKILKEISNFNIDNFHGISIDSRSLKKNNLFLTLKGKKLDGSSFISNALKGR